MIIKMQPKEFERKPLISEKDPQGDAEVYRGRVIIEFWREEAKKSTEPAFAWSVDDPEKPDEEWLQDLLSALKRATRHIEDVYRFQISGSTSSGE
jgi:hypothetical protein